MCLDYVVQARVFWEFRRVREKWGGWERKSTWDGYN